MTTIPSTSIPQGLAVVETFDGRWFPTLAPEATNPPALLHLIDGPPDIPPALERDGRGGYQLREEAIEACWAWYEAAVLPLEWRTLAAHTEVYPERNRWYLEEIARLTGHTVHVCRTEASVITDAPQVITAQGATPDETIETLYQQVYEWSRKLADPLALLMPA